MLRNISWIWIVAALAGNCLGQTTGAFYLGADISTLGRMERRGAVYPDDGKPGDALAIFMKHGWTCFRLRIWVDPRGGTNGLDYTRDLGKRIKAAGGTTTRPNNDANSLFDAEGNPLPAMDVLR